jgi:hypothetical protein
MAIKKQQMTATPELYLKKNKPFFKVPHFNETVKPISIPNTRLITIPSHLFPRDNCCHGNMIIV